MFIKWDHGRVGTQERNCKVSRQATLEFQGVWPTKASSDSLSHQTKEERQFPLHQRTSGEQAMAVSSGSI